MIRHDLDDYIDGEDLDFYNEFCLYPSPKKSINKKTKKILLFIMGGLALTALTSVVLRKLQEK